MPRPFINAFNAGELSPSLDARIDSDKYKNGCRILENAIPKIQGGVRSRSGMQYMGSAKYPNKQVRLLPFSFDVTTSFVLEFGDGYIRFWSNGQQVLSGGLPLEISSPYAEEDVFNIQFTQVNDVVYLVDGTHPPQKLTRIADDNWTIADVDWVWPAMQDENETTNTLGTQIITDLLRLNVEEWPQRIGTYNAVMRFSGTLDTNAGLTKVARLERWNGSAWAAVTGGTVTWTGTAPTADVTYVCATLGTTLPDGAKCDTFRISYNGPTSAGAITLYTDYSTIYEELHSVGPPTYHTNWRYSVAIDCSLTQPQASLQECTVPANKQWRVRVKSLATIPGSNTLKVQKWTGSWTDVATITLVANKWVTYNGAVIGSDTIYRLKWGGSTAVSGAAWETTTGFAMEKHETFVFGPPPPTVPSWFPGQWTGHQGEPQRGIMVLEQVTPSGTTDVKLTLDATTGNNVTMTASAAAGSANIFDPSHVGSYWQIGHRRDPEDTPGKGYLEGVPSGATAQTLYSAPNTATMTTTPSATGGLRVLGRWDFYTYGTWQGNVSLQVLRSDNATWETIRTWSSGGTSADRNVIATGIAETEQVMRIKYVKPAVAPSSARFFLEPVDSTIYGLVKVTGYTSPTVVTVTVLKDVWDVTATRRWSEGSWSSFRGYPRSIAVDDQRIVYGGTEHEPLTIWGSVIGDFENFRRTTLEDSSYAFRIASAKGNSIVWMAHQTRFMVGTQGDEWLIEAGSNSNNGVVTPLSVKITLQTSYGSAYVQPAVASDTIMFVERGRKRIREFVYQFDRQAFAAPDLCLLAEHILADDEVKQLAFQAVHDPVVWMVTKNHQLASMTFERDQNVVGWSRHITDGQVESVCVIYGFEADEVWFCVKRNINGSDVRYIERLDPLRQSKLDADDVASFIYLDSAKEIMQTADTAVTGLSHLEGKTVNILADGLVQRSKVVSAGAITLDTAAEHIIVGLPFTVRLQPNKIELGMPDGTSQGRRWHCCQSMLRFHRTGAAQYADGPDAPFFDVPFRTEGRPATEIEPSFTGEKKIFLAATHRESLDLTFRNTQPLPFSLLAVAPIVEASGQ